MTKITFIYIIFSSYRIADWDNNVKRLKNSSHLDILNLELNLQSKPNRHENDKYMEIPLRDYFVEAYKRARKIADTYSQ